MKKFLKIITIYFAIISTITFSMFIMEESIQMCVFGTWPAQDAGAWALVEQNLKKMEHINNTLWTINTFCGWLQPFAYLSYDAYHDSTIAYIQSVRQKIATLRPDVLAGQKITIVFIPQEMSTDKNGLGTTRLGDLTIHKLPISLRISTTCTGTVRKATNDNYILNCNRQ